MTEPPLRAAIIPVTPLQQNCSLIWCTATMRAAFVDPGGDLPRLKAAASQAGVTVEKILLTHGHIDHCGGAGILAEELGVPIEGPHEEDRYWIDRLAEDGAKYGVTGRPFEPSRWLADGDQVSVGELTLSTFAIAPATPPATSSSTIRHRGSRWSATCCSRARWAAGISRAATSSN